MIELEKSYLAKAIPQGLENCPSKEIIDIYIPKSKGHAAIRIRKNGDSYVITKKTVLSKNSFHKSKEQTIEIDEEEFEILSQTPGKKIHKVRHLYNHNGFTAEVDIFQGPLKGLVMIDFEFKTQEELNNFVKPEFCLVDVRGDSILGHIFAGGVLCGKSYSDIQEELEKCNYKKLEE